MEFIWVVAVRSTRVTFVGKYVDTCRTWLVIHLLGRLRQEIINVASLGCIMKLSQK